MNLIRDTWVLSAGLLVCRVLRVVRFEQEIPLMVFKQENLISTKLQDKLRHVTGSTRKSRIRCTPRLKYRLDTSIRNYIVTTIRQVQHPCCSSTSCGALW